MITAFGMPRLPGAVPTIQLPAPVAHADLIEQIAQLDAQNNTYVREATLRRGETVTALLQRISLDDRAATHFIRTDAQARRLLKLSAGQTVRVTLDDERKLLTLHADLAAGAQYLSVARAGSRGFRASLQTLRKDVDWSMRSGQIGRNFFAAMQQAQVPPQVVAQIVKVFSGVVDFRRDVRPGDRFRIVFERVRRNQATVGFGRLLAVEVLNRGKLHQALWYEANQGGSGDYYGFDGQPVRRSPMRKPLDFTRISSKFGGRVHPLSGNWIRHTGVDFAAPTGTKVVASGQGVVEFAGVRGGYGKLVIVNHTGGYATYYAHLSGFGAGIKRGTKVAQGRLVGYVGQTGWATGPHLHFELRRRNQPIDPLHATLFGAPPLEGKQLQAFNRHADNLLERIDLIRSIQVGSIDS